MFMRFLPHFQSAFRCKLSRHGALTASVAAAAALAATAALMPAKTEANGRPDWAAAALDPSIARGSESEVAGARTPANRAAARKMPRRVASLGRPTTDAMSSPPSVTGRGVIWSAPSRCLNGQLASVVSEVASSFGRVRVNSTCRSRGHNSRVGGARHSHHLPGNAVDFRVWGNVRATHAFLRSHPSVGGLKHYGGGLFHIDTGARRPM